MTKMMKFSFLLLVFALFAVNSFAQDVSTSVDSAFISFTERPPMEKLYLHTDRNTYSSGGTIWFRGYLVTATGNRPAAMSNFIYVELYDRADSLVCRKKIKKTDGIFSGNIKLDTHLSEGSYFMQAYSMWMLNEGLDYVFYKAIHIDNLQTQRVSSTIEISGNETTANIYFADKEGAPVIDTPVKCTLHLGNSEAQVLKRKTGADGKISFDFIPEKNALANPFVEVEFEDSPMEYRTKFFLKKENEKQFDVQFFPEGGDLIAGVENRVAFKAIGSDGYSREIKGIVINSRNDTITTISSQHTGMGYIRMIPQVGEQYFAEIKDAGNNVLNVPLPRALEKGAALSLMSRGGVIHLNIRQQNYNVLDSCYLLIHAGERKVLTKKLEATYYKIPEEILPEGIVNFVLLNGKKEALSSRMIFIRKDTKPELLIEPNQENYRRREKVDLKLSIPREDTSAYNASFSLAVTDDLVVEHDSLSDNIYSNLLLTSELRGYIENPGFYFQNNADSTNFYLDLLMLTQGWKRFDINELLANKSLSAKYYLEYGQTLSGKYQKMILQRKKPTEITALAVDPVIMASAFTDDDNNFVFNQLDFPDSTKIIIQAQRLTNVKQEPAGLIVLDKDTFPSFQHIGRMPVLTEGFTGKARENAVERIYYEDGGKMIVLDEIEVKGNDKTRQLLEMKYGSSSYIYDAERIAKTFPVSQSIDLVVRRLPGIARVEDGSVYLTRGTGAAEMLMDGIDLSINDLSDLYSDDIDHIAVITGPSAAVYSRKGGAGGVILISMKEGWKFNYELKGVKKVMPLGYQKPVEFYVPKYEVDSIRMLRQPDMRTTVYWNPKINVQTGEGTTVSFYTADPATTYTYIIEGVGEDGQLYRSVGKLRREDE
ncbi:TonB-dependent receptor plug domain-containing protein [Maribellus sp. YY47]|uniref:TonB-dependent receptor plug domain-containing protein n=1 Tax=Maribellus sp. YY47 TaxID=2929486 RepID=UPI002001070C|nr:TonB-dependent receptor plug domain-containing protein [Maribellus sp. YY47]MCK3684147.1 Plug domain-containing protein [Maribellus sp. YY47]